FSPAASTRTPASMSSWLYFPMVVRSCSDGISPASVRLSAFTIIMNLTSLSLHLLVEWRLSISTPAVRPGNRRRYHDEKQHSAVGDSGSAGGVVRLCRWRKARPSGRSDAAGTDGAAWTVSQIYRCCGGVRRRWSNPPVGAADSTSPDPAGRFRSDCDHDGSDGDHRVRRSTRWRAGSVRDRRAAERRRLSAHPVYCVIVADRRPARRAPLSQGTRRALACAARAIC